MATLVLLALMANPHLSTAESQIRDLEEAAALKTLEQARAWPNNTPADLARVHLLFGLAHAGLAHEEDAVQSFRAALLLDPQLRLPEGSSPRVEEWWALAGGGSGKPPPVVDAPKIEPLPAPPQPAPVAVVAPAPPPEQPSPAWRKWGGRGLVAVGVAALATGAIFGSRAASASGRAQEHPDVGESSRLQSEAERSASTANVLYGTGGAAAAAGAALIVWTWE